MSSPRVQIGIYLVPRMLLAGAGLAVQRGNPHASHQRADMLAAYPESGSNQLVPKRSSAHERELKMQLVNAPHERQIGGTHRSGLVVRAAAAYPDQFGLSRD